MKPAQIRAARRSARALPARRARGYADIAEHLRRTISHRYGPGAKIASERELALEFDVNRHTVRRALQDLEARGIISIVHGSGSIVVRRPMEHRVTYDTRFTTSAELAGISTRTEIVEVGDPSPAELRMTRSLAGVTPFKKIVTLRYANGAPVCWIRHLLLRRDVDALVESFAGGSLHEHIFKRWGIRLRRRESRVSADIAGASDIHLLLVPRNLPILCANSVNVDARTGKIGEISLTRFRSDAVDLRFEMPAAGR